MLKVEEHVANEPFAILLGNDDVIKAEPPCITQLMNFREKRGSQIY
jgi:UTP-glucose-1-phosphate uridylyltransferase